MHRIRRLARAVPLLLVAALLASLGPAGADEGTPLFGGDISWPQCPPEVGGDPAGYGLPLPGPSARFVVIGTTNGYGFSVNPCLQQHTDWARSRGLLTAAYALTTFPTPAQLSEYRDDGPYDASTRQGQLRNVGWAQAEYTMARMREAGLDVPFLWYDVEPVSGDWRPPWSSDTAENAQVVLGALRSYQDAGLEVGFYSTPALWRQVVGDGLPELRGHDEWRTAGRRGQAVAESRCTDPSQSFQGGPAVLAQWYDDTADYDVTCPAHSGGASLQRFFRSWAPEKSRAVRYAPAD